MDEVTHERIVGDIGALLGSVLPVAELYPSRRLSQTITKIEEALMWAERIRTDRNELK